MKELTIPFSLFDFFAVLLPGGVGLFGAYLFINPALTRAGHDAAFSQTILAQFSGDLILVTGAVLCSYLMGLVLSALSELLIDRPVNQVWGAHVVRDLNHYNVRKAVEKKFGADILKQSIRRTFVMIESTVGTHMPDAAASAKKFIALAVMFQSLAMALLLVGAALIRGFVAGLLFSGAWARLVGAVAVVLALVGLSLWSYRRYKRMWSQMMCMSFVAWAIPGEPLEPNGADEPARSLAHRD